MDTKYPLFISVFLIMSIIGFFISYLLYTSWSYVYPQWLWNINLKWDMLDGIVLSAMVFFIILIKFPDKPFLWLLFAIMLGWTIGMMVLFFSL